MNYVPYTIQIPVTRAFRQCGENLEIRLGSLILEAKTSYIILGTQCMAYLVCLGHISNTVPVLRSLAIHILG